MSKRERRSSRNKDTTISPSRVTEAGDLPSFLQNILESSTEYSIHSSIGAGYNSTVASITG